MTQSAHEKSPIAATFLLAAVAGMVASTLNALVRGKGPDRRQLIDKVDHLSRRVEALAAEKARDRHQTWYAGYAAGLRDQQDPSAATATGDVVQMRPRDTVRRRPSR